MNFAMLAYLAACGNSIDFSWNVINPDYNQSANVHFLKKNCKHWNYWLAPLIHERLFDDDASSNFDENFYDIYDEVMGYLKDAPCDGPHNFGPQNPTFSSNGPIHFHYNHDNKDYSCGP